MTGRRGTHRHWAAHWRLGSVAGCGRRSDVGDFFRLAKSGNLFHARRKAWVRLVPWVAGTPARLRWPICWLRHRLCRGLMDRAALRSRSTDRLKSSWPSNGPISSTTRAGLGQRGHRWVAAPLRSRRLLGASRRRSRSQSRPEGLTSRLAGKKIRRSLCAIRVAAVRSSSDRTGATAGLSRSRTDRRLPNRPAEIAGHGDLSEANCAAAAQKLRHPLRHRRVAFTVHPPLCYRHSKPGASAVASLARQPSGRLRT